MYLHTWYEAYNSVAHSIVDLFDMTLSYGGNYWAKDKANWDSVEAMQSAAFAKLGYQELDTLLTHFEAKDYNFDWTQCTNGKGSFGSKYDKCQAVSGLAEFERGADTVRNMMKSSDTRKVNLFEMQANRLQKLLVLLGDKYRQEIVYPMDKVTTDDTEFMMSYYSDHAVYNYRTHNSAQVDMGNFSRSDFSHITPVTKTVNINSKKSFRSAGVYALPGQTVNVTRNDNSDLTVKVFINTLRSGATHQFEPNHYNRPKYLQTPHFEIKSGETIALTSPYGGPMQLEFSQNDLPVEITFENVGEHAYWDGDEDNESFEQKLDAGDYDWAELVTPGFEVHSTLEKMRKSMSDPKWGDAQALAAGTMRYMHNLPHALAGFKGSGIDPIPELQDFAADNNWEMKTIDKVQHMNADQAACGYGCSGNPYDAYWAFSPVGHGDVHELGHGLQGGRRFAGWENHSMTNYYSYFTKSQYYIDTGEISECQNLPLEANFNILQASVNQANPSAYVQEKLWGNNSWSKSAAMFIQMMMAVQHEGALLDGWMLRGRLHMFERELASATKDESTWLDKRNNLGMNDYSLAEAKAIDNNDWYLIALSYTTQTDFRDYLTMWAIPFSDKAATQTESLGYPVLPRRYFVSGSKDYCQGLDKPKRLIDGAQIW